jgi:CDP-glucose 4,6-dehydratase
MRKNFWKNKKVFITGHTGFKGSWLTLILHSLGAKIVGYALNPITKPNFFDNLNLSKYLIKDYRQDINNFIKLNNAIKNFNPSIVFHLAAQSSVLVSYQKPRETVEANVIGTTNLLESMKKTKSIKSAIIVTTDKVYLNQEKKKKFKEESKLGGHDIYSSSKAACDIITESYIKSFFSKSSCGIAIVRSGNCIGGGDWTKDRIVKDCAESFVRNEKLTIRSPNATRPWQHVLDPLFGYLKLSQKLFNNNRYNGAWNFGPNKKNNLKVKQLVLIGKKIFNSMSKIVLQKKNYYESENLALDSSKAKKLLNWQTKFKDREALNMTFDWYKNFYKIRNKKLLLKLSFNQIKNFKLKHKI